MRPILLAILAALLCASLAAASPDFLTDSGRTAYDTDAALDEYAHAGDLAADQFRLSDGQAAAHTDDVNFDDELELGALHKTRYPKFILQACSAPVRGYNKKCRGKRGVAWRICTAKARNSATAACKHRMLHELRLKNVRRRCIATGDGVFKGCLAKKSLSRGRCGAEARRSRDVCFTKQISNNRKGCRNAKSRRVKYCRKLKHPLTRRRCLKSAHQSSLACFRRNATLAEVNHDLRKCNREGNKFMKRCHGKRTCIKITRDSVAACRRKHQARLG